jgi:hypothetical protein
MCAEHLEKHPAFVEMTRAVLLSSHDDCSPSIQDTNLTPTLFLTCRNQRCGQTLTWKFQYWELRTDQQLECWVHFNAPYTTDIQPHSLIPLFHHFWFIRY